MRQAKTSPHLQSSEQLSLRPQTSLRLLDRYLGVDYLLADLLLKTYSSNRRQLLQHASSLLESFLARLDTYDLLSKPNKRLLEQYQEDRKNFQLASKTDAAERRRVKVTRFQEEKSLKTNLEVLKCFQAHHLDSDQSTAAENQIWATHER